MLATLATGHPAIPTAGHFDFVPVLYAALLILAVRRTRIPFPLWILPIILVLGGLIDSIANALHLSSLNVASLLLLLAIFIPRRRTPAPHQDPPVV